MNQDKCVGLKLNEPLKRRNEKNKPIKQTATATILMTCQYFWTNFETGTRPYRNTLPLGVGQRKKGNCQAKRKTADLKSKLVMIVA